MTDLSVTLYAWWLLPYLALGVLLFVPLSYWSWRQLANPREPFWKDTLRLLRTRGAWWRVLLQIVLWPAAIWELAR